MSAMRGVSRRDFLKQCLIGAAVLRTSDTMEMFAASQQGRALAKSRVVIARDDLRQSGHALHLLA
jgi:hypothetical protein